MNRLIWAVVALALAAIASAAAAKNPEKKELSDTELMRAAASELSVEPQARAEEESGATVVTDISSLERNTHALPPAEFSLGYASHRPRGTGRISDSETYPLDGLSSRPMAMMKVDRWFREGSRTARTLRWGAELQLGAGWNDLVLRTSRGVTHDDVRLFSVLVSAGPVLELMLPVWHGAAFGAVPSVGRQFLVQSTAAPVANGTLQANFWQGSVYGKVLLGENFFARLEVQRRGELGTSDGLSIQDSAGLAMMGFMF